MTTRNRVVALGNGGQPIFDGPFDVAGTAVDSSIGTFWVLKTDGIFQNAAEVQASAQPDAKPGDVRYVDLHGGGPNGDQPDGRITLDDRYAAGSAIPDVTGGLFVDGRYRRFDFTLNPRGPPGGQIFKVGRHPAHRPGRISNLPRGQSPPPPPQPTTHPPRA